jgi:hypothetical protein
MILAAPAWLMGSSVRKVPNGLPATSVACYAPAVTPTPDAPATKEDIGLLMEAIGKLYSANQQWKEEIIDHLDKRVAASEAQTKAHFDLVAENITHDFQHGALHDRIEQHGDRIGRLERHVGLAA